ncbi:hypothetical protein HanIR_Chr03g0146331 [Helianthus annuus]|nr:hypothetical protein HanIR_Chr03g0146331 [Helianthus annuus]
MILPPFQRLQFCPQLKIMILPLFFFCKNYSSILFYLVDLVLLLFVLNSSLSLAHWS